MRVGGPFWLSVCGDVTRAVSVDVRKSPTTTNMASESNIPSPLSQRSNETDESSSPIKRGRGRQRGRPRSRRSGRRGASSRGQRGGQQSRGRGRGQKDSLVEEAVAALQARKQRIQLQVDSMSEANVRDVLREVLEKQPSLIFDLVEPPQQSGGYHPSGDNPSPSWCKCLRCREMPTDIEKVCCSRQPGNCLSQTADMEVLVLDEAVLAIARLQRQDILALPHEENQSKSNRHTAYRQFILWQHGRLGVGVRNVIASCCVWRIRDKFPDPFGQYAGFKAGRFG